MDTCEQKASYYTPPMRRIIGDGTRGIFYFAWVIPDALLKYTADSCGDVRLHFR